jgi:alpha-ketoglutarate-dependent taurine dioxygenase
MAWTLTGSPDNYVAAAGGFLRSRPVHNTIQLVALDSLRVHGTYAFGDVAPLFGWWRPAAGPVTAALMHTPPYPVLLTRLPANAAGDLAEALAGRGRQLPGVNAERSDAETFAAAWSGLTGAGWREFRRSRLFQLGQLPPLRDGFFLLRDVPCRPGTVLTVAGSMGYVRETNYGRLFDVRVEATPANLAFTGLPIAPHTDNPYRDPVPTVQLLHCLASAVEGGDSGLVDGFQAAALLRAADPAAFGILTRTPVTFTYADATAELRATRPMITTDPRGRIREVRFNNRSLQPLRLGREGSPDETVAFYAAYRAFAETIIRPDLMLTFRLAPGDCVVFDNTRILHARTGFAATGRRHLQGCYTDLDGVASTLAVLRRGREATR